MWPGYRPKPVSATNADHAVTHNNLLWIDTSKNSMQLAVGTL